MTLEEMEQRILALEKAVAQLQQQQARSSESVFAKDDIRRGVEYDLTPEVMPHVTIDLHT